MPDEQQKIISLDNLKEYTVTLYAELDTRYVKPSVTQFDNSITFRHDISIDGKTYFGGTHSYFDAEGIFFDDFDGGGTKLYSWNGDYYCPYVDGNFYVDGEMLLHTVQEVNYSGILFKVWDDSIDDYQTQRINFVGPNRTVALKDDLPHLYYMNLLVHIIDDNGDYDVDFNLPPIVASSDTTIDTLAKLSAFLKDNVMGTNGNMYVGDIGRLYFFTNELSFDDHAHNAVKHLEHVESCSVQTIAVIQII